MSEKVVKSFTNPFGDLGVRVHIEASAYPSELYEEGGSSQPFCSNDCIMDCCGMLRAMDSPVYRLGKACSTEMVRNGTYKLLGEATALADWEAISAGLAQRVGRHAQDPAWPQEGVEASIDYVCERFRRACCASELAVLMLRLAVRAACLAGSWYGPWENRQALQELLKVNAWTALLSAVKALLVTFGPNLAKQYNAINIVSDILHVSRAPLQTLPRDWAGSFLQRQYRSLCLPCHGGVGARADLVQPERAACAPGV